MLTNQINSETQAAYSPPLAALLTLARHEITEAAKLRLYLLSAAALLNNGCTLQDAAHRTYLNIEAKPDVNHTQALLELVLIRDTIHTGLTRLIELYEQGTNEETRLDAEGGQ